jgi:ketosteroid isomerase-like protein
MVAMKFRSALVAVVLFAALACAAAMASTKTSASDDARKALDAFNQQYVSACQQMDNAATAAMWGDDGADLIQGMAPMVGKKTISDWLNGLTPQLAGAKMVYCTVDWKDVQVRGDFAYEWGINRQKIEFPPPQKPFESEGKILLILKRQPGGSWNIAVETWSANPAPQQVR